MSETKQEDHTSLEALEALGPTIETEEQATKWVEELVEDTEVARAQCDNLSLLGGPGGVRELRRVFLRWLLARGQSLGALYALKRTGRLSDRAYMELRGRILATRVPTIQNEILFS